MIRTIIVDDEQNSTDALTILLANLRNDIEVIGIARNAEDAVELIKRNQPNIDLVFLDVQMPKGDGFSVLQQLAVIDFKVIFVTAFERFAIRAIKFSALDYILKPVDPGELKTSLDHFDKEESFKVGAPMMEFKKAITQKTFFDKLAVSSMDKVQFIPIQRIIYLESDNNYSIVHLDDKQHIVASKGIGFYEELLEASHFFRIHNSYLINLKRVNTYIKGRGGYIELDSGLKLEVSVRKKDDLMRMLYPE